MKRADVFEAARVLRPAKNTFVRRSLRFVRRGSAAYRGAHRSLCEGCDGSADTKPDLGVLPRAILAFTEKVYSVSLEREVRQPSIGSSLCPPWMRSAEFVGGIDAGDLQPECR